MSQGETVIALLLVIIAFFLYHIAKQLSFLTGKRLKLNPFKTQQFKPFSKSKKPETPHEKLPN